MRIYICLYFSVVWYYGPRYLNSETWDVIWSQTFTSKVELLRLLLKFHSVYYVFLLLRRKSHASKDCLRVSNFTFNCSIDSPNKTTSSAKKILHGVNSWMCSISTSKIKVKKVSVEGWPSVQSYCYEKIVYIPILHPHTSSRSLMHILDNSSISILIFFFYRASHIISLGTLSYAFFNQWKLS